jgi:4-aminobutyrate aminotransferase-like enzyme
LPAIVTVGERATAIWVAGALLRPGVIEAFGKRIRYFNIFGGNPVSCAVAHAVLKVIKAGRRLVLISATGNEGQILKIRPPLVFSSKDAKLFLATLDGC